MAVTIRLRRVGKTKHPFYRVVVQDKRNAPVSKVIEELGTHDPRSNPPVLKIDVERANYWVSQGAILTDTVQSIFKANKIIAAKAA